MRLADLVALAIGAVALVSLAGGAGERDPFGPGPASRADAVPVSRDTFLSRPYDRAMMRREAERAGAMPGR